MGFEELSGDALIGWLGRWIGDMAGAVPIETASASNAGLVTVSVQGELIRIELTAAAMQLGPEQLGHGIERAYGQAYLAALRDVDLILNRISEDVEQDQTLVMRIKQLRARYVDLNGLKAILKRRQAERDSEREDPSDWDPSADPLQRGIPRGL